MLIHCTKKLRDKLKVQPETATDQGDESALFSWHANVTQINRRQSVVLMNDQSQYVIVLYGMRAKDFTKMGSIIEQAIRMVWREEGMKEEVINHYITQAGDVQFGKTKNRTLVARLNRACYEVGFFEDEIDEKQLVQPDLSLSASRRLVGDGKGDYIHPNEVLYENLQQYFGEKIFSVRAVEVDVQLLVETKEIRRRLIVPLNRSFPQLHKILQTAFDWEDYHLHEFFVFENPKKEAALSFNHPGYMADGTKALVNLVDNEEAFDYPSDIPVKLETGVKLSEYLPAAKQLVYIYDFGDNWRHLISVTDVIEDYPSNHPVCLDGTGDAPPEDVGGEGGYLEFLAIMDDPEHPDHEHMKQWASGQLHASYDLEIINHFLKKL